MAEPRVLIDLDFHFTSGQLLAVQLREGIDRHDEVDGRITITIANDDGGSTTFAIHADKLNAVQTRRLIVKDDDGA